MEVAVVQLLVDANECAVPFEEYGEAKMILDTTKQELASGQNEGPRRKSRRRTNQPPHPKGLLQSLRVKKAMLISMLRGNPLLAN